MWRVDFYMDCRISGRRGRRPLRNLRCEGCCRLGIWGVRVCRCLGVRGLRVCGVWGFYYYYYFKFFYRLM